jgi:hypothetical protein
VKKTSENKKGVLISELHGKFVSTTIRDILPNGIKLEINSQGQITGKYAAAHMETTTITQKMDEALIGSQKLWR